MGPLNTKQHYDKVMSYIDKGVQEGADLVVDGRGLKLQGYENGYFMGGSIFDRVTSDMSIYTDEIFGPVLSVVRAPDYDSGARPGQRPRVRQRHGDLHPGRRRRPALRRPTPRSAWSASTCRFPVPMAFHSFGGWKRSLFGDHHMHGAEGVRFYTKLKTITSRWPTGIREGADFNIPTM